MILVYLFAMAFSINNALEAISQQDYTEAGLWVLAVGAVVVVMLTKGEKAGQR